MPFSTWRIFEALTAREMNRELNRALWRAGITGFVIGVLAGLALARVL